MDVGGWLRSLRLGQYEVNFRDNKIDADVLPQLTADDLKDIGVSAVGDRRRLLAAIAALSGPSPSANPPASSPKPAPGKGRETSAERRPITVMFCDLVGSTSLASKLDAEDWRNLVESYLEEASAAVTDLGGHVLKKLGDGLMALFGYPHAQENDAERAVRAALAIQRALADLNARNPRLGAPELSARIGIECGSVVVDASGEVFGEAPNVAARVQVAAEPGTVLVTASVQRQTAGLFVAEDKGAHELRGVAQPVRLYRIVRASGGGRRGGARALTPLVGREEELDLLSRRWARARSGEGQFALIVGEPGIGKSRLVEEFRAKLAETPHTWVEWAASQLLQNTPLHPLAEWGRLRYGGADASDWQKLADLENTLRLIGLDAAEYAPLLAPLFDVALPEDRAAKFAPEELRRRQLAAMTALFLAGARSQPVVLAFEDLHWADPTSLDLLRALVERGAKAPLLIVATTRPEFRPDWSLRSHHSVISLAPLDRAQVRRMVGEIASQHALSDEMIDGVGERTGGVPLFVEEVTRLLLERDAQGGAQAIPPTLQQSLAARLDRLGEAREVAQIGAVLGREFSYALLRAVAAVDDRGPVGGVGDPALQRGAAALTERGYSGPALQSALDRLTEADLLFVDGAPPTAAYRFKHALIQDAAYESLLKSRRQALHRRAAEALRDANAEPEAIAHHFTEAGLDDPAIEWWGKAGDQALRRSAFQEAIAHLGKAIEMADRAGATARRATGGATAPNQRRTQLHVAYGNALMAARGFGAPEATEAFVRARESASGDKDAPDRLAVDYGLWAGSYNRGELPSFGAQAAVFLNDLEARPDSPEAGVAHRVAAVTHWFAGEYREARDHLERALVLFQPGRDDDLAFRFGLDPGVAAMGFLANVSWPLGEVDHALSFIDRLHTRMERVSHIASRSWGTMNSALLDLMRGDHTCAAPKAFELARLAHEHELTIYGAFGVFLEGWATAASGAPGDGLERMRRGAELLREQNVLNFDGLFKIALAEAEDRAGDPDRAVAILDEALATANRLGYRAFEAELHRARGETLLKRDRTAASAEEAFQAAIAVARRQATRSFELRAALSLAKLYQSTARPADAHGVLAQALEGFAPTPEMPEIAEAQALLAALAETDEVKAEATQRQRMTQLQVDYGAALISARGYGAPETTEAFARARESAPGDTDAPERLAADYGLWAGSYTRGELPSMRMHAAAFVRDVEARPDSPEAGIAHRVQAKTHYFAGEFAEAVRELERALALFEPGRDDDLAVHFPPDPGVASMIYLAFASWALGEAGRAVSFIERMGARMAELSHAPTLAFGRVLEAFFSLMRGDRPRARASVSELARIVRDHDLPNFRAFGEFLVGWATIDGGALADGLEAMRHGAESLRRQNVVVYDGLVKIALAEAEVRAGDPARALKVLEEALATCDRTGYRAYECELHRARGELLLGCRPADPAPAEDALRTAVAIAQREGARGYELLASLSLAKLNRSTARLADAHAVLAPALQGFSPTQEMPEFAEAQALLAELAETEDVKAETARREQRLRLESGYAAAIGWSKGFAGEETKAAFDRVEKALAAHPGADPAPLPALEGRWAAAMMRGEMDAARAAAEVLLAAAERTMRAATIAVARRSFGATLVVQGDLAGASRQLREAIELADREPFADPGTSVSPEAGASAMAHLSLAAWMMGEFDRSRALIEQASLRAEQRQCVPTGTVLRYLAALREMLRGDPIACLPRARAFVEFCESHQIEQFRGAGEAALAWAEARVEPTMSEVRIARFRESLADLEARGHRLYLPLCLGRLAEIELGHFDPESAVRRIEEARKLAQDGGQRVLKRFLDRLLGEALLRRNAADAGAAEEAFQRSIASARDMGARAFRLQASLALAKLYQSTARPADAHAVLAPALEGFAPSPEMPEIDEALALLAATGALL